MSYQRILVPVDNDQAAFDALQEAIKLAIGKSIIGLVYVVNDGYPVDDEACELIDFDAMELAVTQTGERTLQHFSEIVRESGIAVDTVLIQPLGGPPNAINQEAKKWMADLIVIGAHGAEDSANTQLGSVANELLRIASIPVLLVRKSSNICTDSSTSNVVKFRRR